MASDPGPAISVLQLRIALRGLSPPVWRRVLVPEHLTLGQLHHVVQVVQVVQVVMGWADEHLHTFSIRGRRYGEAHAAREGPIVLEDLRDKVDRWLTWLDRRFDRQTVKIGCERWRGRPATKIRPIRYHKPLGYDESA